MKRSIAILMALVLVSALLAVFVSAEDAPEAIDLLPPKDTVWSLNEHIGNKVNITYQDDAIVLAGEQKTEDDSWPSADYDFTPFTVNVDDYDLDIDFSIQGEGSARGAISFYFNSSKDTGYSIGNTAVKPALGIEEKGNDYYPGDYKVKVSLADVAKSKDYDWDVEWSKAVVDNSLTFSGMRVFACGGGTVLLRSLKLVPKSEEPVKETITVDGKLDDTGWAEDKWVLASIDNDTASIQDTPEEKLKDAFEFKVNMRTDDEKLYVAVIANHELVPGTGVGAESTRSGLSFRIWMHSDPEYKQYTHFYDIWPDANKDTRTAAKYNKSTTENSGANIENSSFVGVVGETEDGMAVYEMSVNLNEFMKEGDDTIHYFVNLVNGATSGYFVGVIYPPIPLGARNELDQTYMPWIEWYTESDGVLKVADAKLGVVEPKNDDPTPGDGDANYVQEIAAKVGDPAADGKFDIVFDTTTDENGNVKSVITLKGFDADSKISSILFPIFFDGERLEQNFQINDDNSVNCFDALPGDKWENMTVYNPADDNSDVNNFPGQAHVYVQILNAEKEDQVCKGDTEINITLNFKLKEGYDIGGIWIPTENVEATSWDDPAGRDILRATGGSAFAERPEDQPSDPTPPVDDPTQPGDAGILVFAILGVLAVVGAAVVIKVRK
ncbi:MAG: hypothetical protein II715_04435 [Clostridia bacterium]|nr:hypothetical protein [Clostridia bacterium]